MQSTSLERSIKFVSSNSTLLYRRANKDGRTHSHTQLSLSLSLSLSHTHTHTHACMHARARARSHTPTHPPTDRHTHMRTLLYAAFANIIISQYRLYHIIITFVYAVKQYVIFSDKQTPSPAPDSNLTRTKTRTPSLWNRQNEPMAGK